MSSADSLGDRMKGFEACAKYKLPNRFPMIVRVDGKAFHSYTKGCQKPFDQKLISAMNDTAAYLCKSIQGSVFAYVQSDEISILVFPWKDIRSQAWFDNELVKMVSVSAGLASSHFTVLSQQIFGVIKPAVFDSRAFVLPELEINNYFIWRQQDWERNSLQLLARQHYSHKELHNKGHDAMHEMLAQKNVDWHTLSNDLKHGRGLKKVSVEANGVLRTKWIVDEDLPVFTQDREYLPKLLSCP